MIGVSPTSGLWPSAAFSRRRCASFGRVDDDPGRRRAAPEQQLVGEARLRRVQRGLVHLAADVAGCRRAGGLHQRLLAGGQGSPAAGRRTALSGTSASSAWRLVDCSCGRWAPGRGGRSVKSGGIDSGARVVTVNSSGASRVRPKVRDRSLPHPARASAGAGQQRAMRNGTRRLMLPWRASLPSNVSRRKRLRVAGLDRVTAPQAVQHQRRDAADDRRVGHIEHIPVTSRPGVRHGRR